MSNLRIITRKAEAEGTEMAASRNAERRCTIRILHSWKEISNYIGLCVRTLQRYEIRFRMPVHRVGGNRGAVLALTDEIDAWVRNTPILSTTIEQHKAHETVHQSDRSCVEYQFSKASKEGGHTKPGQISADLRTTA